MLDTSFQNSVDKSESVLCGEWKEFWVQRIKIPQFFSHLLAFLD